MEKVPSEQLEAKVRKFEELRASLAGVLQAIADAERSLQEAKVVLEEIKKMPEGTDLYKQVGFVLVPVKREELEKELQDKIEEYELKLVKLKKMEEEYRSQLDRLLKEIQRLSQGQGGIALGG